MATKKRKAPAKKKGTTVNKVVVMGKKKRRKSGVGATVGATKKKRRKSGVGATGLINVNNLTAIGKTAIGIAGGIAVSKFVLTPLVNKMVEKYPDAAKLVAFGEMIFGGLVALKAKNPSLKAAGMAMMVIGTNKALDQTKAFEKLGINGVDDYNTVHIPINGPYTEMVAGLMDGRRDVNTSVVAGMDSTNIVAGEFDRTNVVAGEEFDNVFTMPMAKGMF